MRHGDGPDQRLGSQLRASGLGWAYYLNLAEAYGWRPAGTERPPHLPASVPWDGTDAESVASALERALRDPPGAARAALEARHLWEELRAARGHGMALDVSPSDVDHQRSLIAFLRSGSFEIS